MSFMWATQTNIWNVHDHGCHLLLLLFKQRGQKLLQVADIVTFGQSIVTGYTCMVLLWYSVSVITKRQCVIKLNLSSAECAEAWTLLEQDCISSFLVYEISVMKLVCVSKSRKYTENSEFTPIHSQKMHIVFCWINTSGLEVENKPLTLSDFNEFHSVDTWIPDVSVLNRWIRSVE